MPPSPLSVFKGRVFLSALLLLKMLLLTLSCNSRFDKEDTVLSPEAKKAIGHVYVMAGYGRGKEARGYLDSVYRTFKPSRKDLFEKLSLHTQYYLFKQNNISKAKGYIDSMFVLLKNREKLFKTEYLDALFLKSDLKMKEDKKTEAFGYLHDAKDFALENLDSCRSYWYVYRVGVARYGQKQYPEAIHEIKQSLASSRNCFEENDTTNLYMTRQGIFNTLGVCFEKINQPDSAIFYYNRGLKFIDRIMPLFPKESVYLESAKGVFYGNMGGVYITQAKYKEAEEALLKSIKINDRPRYEEIDAQTAKLKLVNLYLKTDSYEKANHVLKDLWVDAEYPQPERKMPIEYKERLYELQWKFYEQQHDKDKAYEWVQRYHLLKDSVELGFLKSKFTNIDISFKLAEQQTNLEFLDKENETKMAYVIVFAVFLVMAVILGYSFWRNGQRLAKLNAHLHNALEALQQSQEENTRLVKVVAHDLRSPMAITISIADIMLKGSDLGESDKEMLEMVKVSNTSTMEMIADLLNMNTTKENLKKDTVDLYSLLKYCADMFGFKAAEKKQTIVLDADQATVEVNREKIWRVVGNLITNAIKFSPEGCIIRLEMKHEGDKVMVRIKDNGIGIPDELKPRIFSLVSDAKRLGTSGELSFGLGLAIAKQIVEAHDGRIGFESEVGKGSTFWFELPLNPA